MLGTKGCIFQYRPSLFAFNPTFLFYINLHDMENVLNEDSNETNTGLLNELLTVAEVADYLRVSRVTAWRWCQEGLIPAFQIGRNWRIPRDELLELLEQSISPIERIESDCDE